MYIYSPFKEGIGSPFAMEYQDNKYNISFVKY